jgi:multicomponent Na+:H+ antiporter subunit C
LIYRSWLLSRADHIQVDMEDIRVARQEIYDDEEDSEIAIEVSDFHENNQPWSKRETVPGIGPKKTALAKGAAAAEPEIHPMTPGKDEV